MQVDIQVFAAKSLPRISQKSRQTPYCVVEMEGIDEIQQTQVSKSSTAPEWNETFSFQIKKECSPKFTIMTNKTVISYLQFTVSDYEDGATMDNWVNMECSNPKLKGGQIHLGLKFTKLFIEEEEILEQIEEEEEVDEFKENYLFNEEFQAYSPHRTPDFKRIKQRVYNDQGGEEEEDEKEENWKKLLRESEEVAKRQYKIFLKKRTPLLMKNEQICANASEE